MLPSLDEIIKKRKVAGLTQKQLSQLAGVSQSLVAKLESGKIDPSYTKVKAIMDVLNRLETKADVSVSKILHSRVVGVQRSNKISKAVQLMKDLGYSQLPVFDGERTIGSISEKTILAQVLAGNELKEISKRSVDEIMDDAFPQVGEDTALPIVSTLLRNYSAVLVSRKGKVVGIVTKADLLKMLS